MTDTDYAHAVAALNEFGLTAEFIDTGGGCKAIYVDGAAVGNPQRYFLLTGGLGPLDLAREDEDTTDVWCVGVYGEPSGQQLAWTELQGCHVAALGDDEAMARALAAVVHVPLGKDPWQLLVDAAELDLPRTVLVHLNVEVPATDKRSADMIADDIIGALDRFDAQDDPTPEDERGGDWYPLVRDLTITIPLAEEV